MNNLEYMKQTITNQISAMTADEFYDFVFLLSEHPADSDSYNLDLSKIFSCKDCKDTYGQCPDKSFLCIDRFKQYCKQNK